MAFYYCLKHQAVEGEHGCRAKHRLGPYETEREAEHALDRVQDRNEAWENDPDWNDDAQDDGDPAP